MKIIRNETAGNLDVQLPGKLVETDWLEQTLEGRKVQVYDCAVIAGPNPDPEQGKRLPFVFESGRKNYDAGHIPGAGFIDILEDISDPSSSLPLMLPSEQKFAEAMSNYGIGDDTCVVLYSSTEPMWAARVWWMLRAFGFDNAAILNGGWGKWATEQKPISQDACKYVYHKFTARSRPEFFAQKEDVINAIGDEQACIINALPLAVHTGEGGPVFGRKGRIAGSVSVPTGMLHDPDTGVYLPAEALRKMFSEVGVDAAKRVVTYCGGGIASSNDAFALALAGYENVAVYDASMFEWGNDDSLPMEQG